MQVLQLWMSDQITLNEARQALDLPLDPVFGHLFRFEVFRRVERKSTPKSTAVDQYEEALRRIVQRMAERWLPRLADWFHFPDAKGLTKEGLKKRKTQAGSALRKQTQALADELGIDFWEASREAAQAGKALLKAAGHADPYFDETHWKKTFAKSMDDLTGRWQTKLKEDLNDLFRQAEEEGWDEETLNAKLDEFLQRLRERSRLLIETETRRMAGLAIDQVFRDNLIDEKQWKAEGDNPCPFCQAMDGRTVRVGKPFLMKNAVLTAEADGKTKTMKMIDRVIAPPLHPRCECVILPVIEGVDWDALPRPEPEPPTRYDATRPRIPDAVYPDPEPRPDGFDLKAAVEARKAQGLNTIDDWVELGDILYQEKLRRMQNRTVKELRNVPKRKKPVETEIPMQEMHRRLVDAARLVNRYEGYPLEKPKAVKEAAEYLELNGPRYMEAVRNLHREILSEVRPLGFPDGKKQKWKTAEIEEEEDQRPSDARDWFEAAAEDVQHCYPTDWWEKSVDEPLGMVKIDGAYGVFVPKESAQKHMNSPDAIMGFSTRGHRDPDQMRHSMAHEFGHRWQEKLPELEDWEREYLRYRSGGKDPVPLNDLAKKAGWLPEFDGLDGYDCGFPWVYSQCSRDDGGFELFTTGMEHFWPWELRGHLGTNLAHDPHREKFFWGLLAGL